MGAEGTRAMQDSFDFIVIGSGSGGAPVARRLAEAGAEVLVLEAGRDPKGVREIEDPSCWFGLQRSIWDWEHDYAPAPEVLGRTIAIPRGKAVGGSSATNAMMWYRGTPADYARWDAEAPGWSFDDCLPFIRRAEDWAGGATHLRGVGGPLSIERSSTEHPLTRAMLAGGRAMGLPELADPNGPDPLGVALGNFNLKDGRRWTSADGYLRPMLGRGVTLLPETRALDLIFTGDRATGVETTAGRFTARRGVIFAAGAFETPRLLTLAGIGPEAELARLGLACRVRAEGVGQNLQDHPLLRALNFRLTEPFGPMQGNGGGTLTIWKSEASLPEADLLAFPIQGRSGVPALMEHYRLPDQGPLFAIGLGVMRSWSRGRLRLTGTGANDPLDIRPGLLTDPRDLAAMKRGVEALLDMVTGPAFAGLFAGFAAPEGRLAGDALDTFVRRGCSTFFHCCGTARMGASNEAPVTPRLAVRGTRGLWVADASVIPVIPACHTHAPVTLIGERAATFILEDA